MSRHSRSWLAPPARLLARMSAPLKGLVALVGLACSPQIGDECVVSTDCSVTTQRLCDTSQPGGYCTVFNCEPGSCPDDSLCVSFHSAASGTFCAGRDDRFQRPFCMAPCGSDGDCRSGYVCREVGKPGDPYGAVLLEHGKLTAKVCVVNQSVSVPDAGEAPVCTGDKGGTPPERQTEPGTFPAHADAGAGDAASDASAGDAGSDAASDASTGDSGSDAASGP